MSPLMSPLTIVPILLMLLPSLGHAQFIRDHQGEGGVRSFHGIGGISRITRSFQSDAEARAEFDRILSTVGLNWIADRIVLRATAEVANAEAGINKSGERFIFYNALFMQKLKQRTAEHWSLVSILAHEVGHHLAFHTEIAGRYHEFELEADYFSGFVLRRLSATLDHAHAAMRAISPTEASETHPGLDQRLQAITIGWTDGASSGPPRGLKGTAPSAEQLAASIPATAEPPHAGTAPGAPQPLRKSTELLIKDCENEENGERVIRACTELIRRVPKHSDAYRHRGRAYVALGEDDKAISDYRRAIELNPNDATTYSNLGTLHEIRREYEQARAYHNKAVEIDRSSAWVRVGRAITLYELGDLDAAVADLNKAIELDPKYGLAYSWRGFIYRRKGNRAQAIEDYRQTLKLNPSDEAAKKSLAELGAQP